MQRHIVYTFIWFYIALLFFWVSITYSSFYKDWNIKIYKIIDKNIYLEDEKLNNVLVWFSSLEDISSYKIDSSCSYDDKFVYNIENIYYFSFRVKNDCIDSLFYLKDNSWKRLYNTNFKLNLLKKSDVYDNYLNYETNKLTSFSQKLRILKDKYSILVASNIEKIILTPDDIKKDIIHSQIEYNKTIIDDILSKRDNKYIIPVYGYELPTKKSKLPNSTRPYRAIYTNAVHEWWDIDTPFWQEVVAIDDWIIIRVIRNFEFNDLKNLKKNWNLSYFDKVNNLDILRWNQVWLKTMKWDVIFYSHLDKVFENIKVWDMVKVGQKLWTVWISWVPDKNYKDYHLHFELRKNDYKKKSSIYDYMNRDWYFKWKSEKYILENQYNIFKKYE